MKRELPELVHGLLQPSAYPERPETVEFVQTHISYVFLAAASVYKIKKPVNFGFLDFSSPELRRASCQEEVRLNRRLSPDVYLGVVPITRSDGRLQVGGSGAAVEWAVNMRRLPEDRMLERLIAADNVPGGAGSRLGEIIGRFHMQAERGDRITAVGGRAAAEGNWRENFEQVRPFRGRTIDGADDDRIQAYVAGFLERESALLAARDAEGYIRDLHGDLRSAQIWILERAPELLLSLAAPASLSAAERELLEGLDGVRILDCIEFNERLRFCDTASDVGFLAMDLDFRRAPDLARDLLSRYLEVTSDTRLPLLLNFYRCYRAYVRGKVDSLGLTEREMGAAQRRRLEARARRCFRLAARYAVQPSPPRLTVMMGISGSGKSYLARLLAIETGAVLISSDITRKRLLGLPLTEHAGPEAYTREQSRRTYASLIAEAERELRQGHSVILDATFLTAAQRAPAASLAKTLDVPFALVWCRAGSELIDKRLRARQDDRYRVSDAEAEIMRSQLKYQEPPREIPRGAVIQADTSRPLATLLRRLRRRLA